MVFDAFELSDEGIHALKMQIKPAQSCEEGGSNARLGCKERGSTAAAVRRVCASRSYLFAESRPWFPVNVRSAARLDT